MTSSTSMPLLEKVSASLTGELRRYLDRHRREVELMIRDGGKDAGERAGAKHARAFDGLLCSLFQAVHAALVREGTWRPVTLAAVGSYGRGAVSFASDLDVRLLCGGAEAELARPIAEALLYPLWDSGLAIGHQVVTPDEQIELARTDLPTATSLLDWRTVAGERAPSDALLERAFEGVFGIGEIKRFLERLAARAHSRTERYGGSVYLLEPDVKNGPGGLRDLDVAHWAARARWRVSGLSDLVRVGVLVPRELKGIEEAAELMWRVRNLLHVLAGRRSDRLSFDRQEQLAETLGYGTGGAAVERFMSDYYRHARSLERARDMLLSRAAPPPTKRPHAVSIGRGLKVINGAVTLAHPGALDTEPALAFRLYDEAVRRRLPVYEFARDAVARAATHPAFAERLRESEEAAKLFVKLVCTAQRSCFRQGSIVGELHDVGLLVAMIPEFAPVVGRVHHDVYHVYTVDAHSVAALDRLRALMRGDLAGEFPLASRLAAEVARPQVLCFATLLHDVGKDIGGRNHSERGHEMAREILQRLRLPDGQIAEVQHLVLKHLRMYHVATRRDIDDPETLSAFCDEVHGREGLRELFLLTVADVSTTSPTAMTSWKARMLDELYRASDRRLSAGSERRGEALDQKRNAVLERLPPDQSREERRFVEHFLQAIPERYLHANDPADILRHMAFAHRTRFEASAVDVLKRDDEYAELAFVADDRPGLLAIVTAALASSRLSVVGAQVYSWLDASGRIRALDMFWVRGSGSADAVVSLVPRLERDLARLLSGEIAPAELVRRGAVAPSWSERRTPEVPTEVAFDDRASAHTVLEVTTRDRPGLLFWLAHALQEAGLTIALAKINTEGTSVADVFYVTDAAGTKLLAPERIEEIRARILDTLAQLSRTESPS